MNCLSFAFSIAEFRNTTDLESTEMALWCVDHTAGISIGVLG